VDFFLCSVWCVILINFGCLSFYSIANLSPCETLPYSVKSAYCVCNIDDLLICMVSWIHLQICNAVAIAKIMNAQAGSNMERSDVSDEL
jgi:hypothetical protein